MKIFLIFLAMILVTCSYCQTYEEQLGKAGDALGQKDYCSALPFFKNAFENEAKIGTYDYAYGAVSAANCNEEKLAFDWLKKAADKGFGQNAGEIDFIASDPLFRKLHQFPEWDEIILSISSSLKEKEILEKKKNENWVNSIKKNAVNPKSNGVFAKANLGFALYFIKVDTFNVPYLVYVPENYNPKKTNKAVVYLHGGVVNTEDFNYQNADLANGEPIFAMGEKFNLILIYPFGKKDFGWVNQLKAFENVNSIVKQVQNLYNIDMKISI